MKLRLLALALAASFPAIAAAPTRTATLSWTAPTLYVSGETIPSNVVITYNVYAGPKGQNPKTLVHSNLTALSDVITSLPYGETCFNVTAVAGGAESAYSAEGCKSFPFPAPSAPATLVVQ